MNIPKIGILALSLEMYDRTSPELKPDREVFFRKAIESLGNIANFKYSGPCSTKESVDQHIREYEAGNVDALMVVFLTYAPSLIALPALIRTRLPLIIWNTQEAFEVPMDAANDFFQRNHGMHGVQDLCSVLNKSGRNFKTVTGHWLDETANQKLSDLFKLAHIVSKLYNSKIGIIGYPMTGMGDFNVDETALLAQIGPEVIHIPVDEYADIIKSVSQRDIDKTVAADRAQFEISSKVTDSELEASARVECGLRKLVERYGLNGWCQLFAALSVSPGIPVMPFVAASKLMGEGIAYSAEGDVCGVVANIIMKELTGSSTLTEMFTMDFKKKHIFMSHMGELNTQMARRDRPVKIISKNFQLSKKANPPTPIFSLQPGKSTLISLTAGLKGKFRIVAGEGEIVDDHEMTKINSPYFMWKPQNALDDFIDSYSAAGGTHHQALGFGQYAEMVEVLADYLGIEFVKV